MKALRRLGELLTAVLLALGMLIAGGGTASAAAPDSHRTATWNVQACTTCWGRMRTLAYTPEVRGLQGVPDRPPTGAVQGESPDRS
ncbi:hypothetical protein [Streptomyces klenkii]|uniref:hypothetical protein n=1 Tax=Streptomyces klenkii TaxID=1420899 RepID=UPI003413C7C5